ncbi:fluoride efflux transporter FluC [Actinomadura viridis]|uniref:fluoride efflux transporter FluC n=1 Tax=Actinomadura viridis TaxID=58110 RepID=UPI0036A01BBC
MPEARPRADHTAAATPPDRGPARTTGRTDHDGRTRDRTGDHGAGRTADPPTRRRRPALRGAPWATLGAISAGGVLGALARYGLTAAFGHGPAEFAWAAFAVNATGCLLIGVLMVAVTEVWQAHPLARPFLGVGILGGFTTFSTYVVDVQLAFRAGAPFTALAYLAATPVCALLAVYAGVRLTRLLTRTREGSR